MPTSIITKISRGLILILLFLLPVLFLPLNWITLEPLKVFSVLLITILISLAIVLKKIKSDTFVISKSWTILSVPLVLLVGLLSSLFSNNIMISLVGRQINFSSFLGLFVLFALAYSITVLFTETKTKTQLFLTIYMSALIAIIFQLLNIFVPIIPSVGFFVNNTINSVGSWTDFGLLSVFTLISSVFVLQYLKRSKFYKVLGMVGMILSSIMIILVNSLFIWIFAGVFALLFIVLNMVMEHDVSVHQRLSQPALVIVVLSLLFILLGGKVGVLLNQTLNLQYEEVRPTLMSTFDVSKDTLQQKPVLGYGINRFDNSWLLNRPEGVNLSNYWDTDFKYGFSNIASVPAMQGILGIIAWLIFILAVFVIAFKLIIQTISSKTDVFINLYSILGSLFFLVVMLAYNPSIVLTTLFFIFFGLLISNANNAGLFSYKEIALEKNPRSALGYLLGLVVILIFFVYSGYVIVTQYSSRIIFDNASKEFSATGDVAQLENKILLSQFIFSSDLYLRSLSDTGLLKINTLLQNKALTQDQAAEQFRAVLGQTIQYAQAAIAYDQQSYINRIALASIYKNLVQLGVEGSKEEAFAVLETADKLSPNNPTIILEKARIYLLLKDLANAKLEIEKSLEVKPNFVDALFLRSQIQTEEGDVEGAAVTLRNAISFQPQNAGLYFQLGLLQYNQQKYADAVVLFENAVIRSPYSANMKYYLGLAYYENSRVQDAIAQFEDLNLLYPNNTDVTKILSNLKSGNNPLNGIESASVQDPVVDEDLPIDEPEQDSEEPA